VYERARPSNEVLCGVNAESDLAPDHVERLVPGVAVGRRAAALGPGLAEDLIAAGLFSGGEDGDLLADHLERRLRLVG